MNWKWNTQRENIFSGPKRYANNKTYWQNLTAPLSEGEKILRYWGCFLFSLGMFGTLIYKFLNDVQYDLQFQLALFSKKYFVLTSNMFCMWMLCFILLGLIIKRWWYWFAHNLWTPLILFAKFKMEDIDVYSSAQFNGIIMTREYFNFNWCFYLFKHLTPDQVKLCVDLEMKTRINGISFLTYNDCRYGFVRDPWIDNFFEDFYLDYADVQSFERIRNQIEIFQRNKIHEGHQLMDLRDLEYIRDHPVKYYFGKYSEIMGNFFENYTGHLILGTIVGTVIFSVLYYNLVEDPNFKENLMIFINRWIENRGNPTINPRGKPIEEVVAPILDSFTKKLLSIFGENNPEEYLGNLQVLMVQNAELLKHFSESPFVPINVIKGLGPELAQKAYNNLLPQTVNQMLPQMLETQKLCIELVEKMAENYSPLEQFEVVVLQNAEMGVLFAVVTFSVIFFTKMITKKNKKLLYLNKLKKNDQQYI